MKKPINKTNLILNISKTVLFILGFPALILAVFLASSYIYENGATYGIWVYGGLGVAALVTVLFGITFLVTGIISKKSGKKNIIRRCTAALVLISVILTTGVWVAIDYVLPGILKDATDDTIKYGEYLASIEKKAVYHGQLLTEFIDWNVNNGNLSEKSRSEYQEEGWGNEEIKNLIKQQYESVNDGYQSFVGPWLPMANDSRLTIPVIVHLIVNEREQSESPFLFYGYNRGAEGKELDPIGWTILDMQEGSMTVDLSSVLGMVTGIVEGMPGDPDILMGQIDQVISSILNGVNRVIPDEDVAGSQIYISLNLATGELKITPSSLERGVWDYMHMAWFNSNQLLFLVISLLPARNVFLMFAGLVAILAIAVGIIREKQYSKKSPSKKDDEEEVAFVETNNFYSNKNDEEVITNHNFNDLPISNPYSIAYNQAMRERENRRFNN